MMRMDQRPPRLTRTLIANMVEGVTKGFSKLELVVSATVQRNKETACVNVGYSQPKNIKPPQGIQFEVPAPNKLGQRHHRSCW